MTDSADRLRQLLARPAVANVLALLAGALALVLAARVLLLVLAGPQLPAPAFGGGIDVAAPAAREPLAGWSLFGNASEAPMAALPESRTSLQLRGTFAALLPEQGVAFIAEGSARERAYRVGEALPDGSTLAEVHVEEVVLSRGGAREVLRLPREARAGGGQAATPARPAAPADPGGGFVGMMSFGAPDRATERAARMPDLSALAEGANILPVVENGRMVGVRLSARDPAALARLGLQPDDLITAVNGIPVDGPHRRDALLESLAAGGVVTVTVRRGESERQLSLAY